ncbi:MAG: flagellar biosynthesis protein FlhB [Planctomycetes bacterium]|nr:flagellar biosynthesis protein FlhB [Planctomycetota bacterium]
MAEQPDKQQKTEEATPQRLREAREKGQVALSTEAVSAMSLIAVAGSLLILGGFLAQAVGAMVAASIEGVSSKGLLTLESDSAAALITDSIRGVSSEFFLVILPALAVAALVGYGQAGLQFAPKAVSMDPSKLNPAKGMTRLFSARSVVRATMALAKVLVVMATIGVLAWLQAPKVSALAGAELGPAMQMVGAILVRCVAGALIAILALGLIDLVFQRSQHSKDLRMTREEVKQEMKNTEGDPHLKARVRQIQRDVASRRMMADVPNATVVVTNPTHYAVALQYDRDSADGGAPKVVAKGFDAVAQRIKKVAADAGVTLFEDRPLARALHARTEIGDEVPADLFEAVAAVLAYVYRVDRRTVGA